MPEIVSVKYAVYMYNQNILYRVLCNVLTFHFQSEAMSTDIFSIYFFPKK